MILVTAAIIIENNKVLIARKKPNSKLAHKWEFPGGKVEKGETPEECLCREIMEELNIKIEIANYFGKNYYTYPQGTVCLMAYQAKWTGGVIQPVDHDEVKWVNLAELPNYDFAPADIPFVKQLSHSLAGK